MLVAKLRDTAQHRSDVQSFMLPSGRAYIVDAEVQDGRVPASKAEYLVGVLDNGVPREVVHLHSPRSWYKAWKIGLRLRLRLDGGKYNRSVEKFSNKNITHGIDRARGRQRGIQSFGSGTR